MTAWQILGIEPTSDQRAIKKAYAKQLKQIDQENDPQAFIQLREALQHAQNQAYYLDDEEDDPFADTTQEFEEQPNIDTSTTQEENQQLHIELLYQQFVEQLQQQDSRFRIDHALENIQSVLECLEPHFQQEYQEKFNNLLKQYDLEQFNHYLLLLEEDAPQTEELNFSIEHPETTDNGNFHTLYSPLPQSYNVNYEITLQQQIDQLIQAFEQHEFNQQNYQLFEAILIEIPQQSLAEQFDYKDQIQSALANIEVEDYPDHFAHFILLWNEYYPHDDDCLDQSYEQDRIQHYIDYYLKKKSLYHYLPEKFHPAFQAVLENEKLKYYDIFLLQRYLKKKYSDEFLQQFFQKLPVKDPDRNASFIYLKHIHELKPFIWLYIAWFMILLMYADVKPFMIFSHIFIMAGFIGLFSSIRAIVLAHEKREIYLLRLNQFWFISGLMLCAMDNMIDHSIHLILTYIWSLLTICVYSYAQYFNPTPITDFILKSCNIKFVDRLMVSIALLILSGILILIYTQKFLSETLWVSVYSLIPIGFILFRDYFYSLYNSLGYRSKEPQENQLNLTLKQQFSHISILLLRGGWIWLMLYLFVKSPQDQYYFYLCLFSFLSLLIITFPQRLISSILKYITYIALISLTSYTIILPMIFGYYFFRTAQEDYRDFKGRS